MAAQVIRSGYRDVQPTDFGAGVVQQQLNKQTDRITLEKDRDFRVKLEDRRYVDDLISKASQEGIKMNDELVEKYRDELANARTTADTKEYRAKRAEVLSEINKANVTYKQNLTTAKAQYEYATQNRLLITPEGWEILHRNMSDPSSANPEEFWNKGVNMDMAITDWAQNNFKDLEQSTINLKSVDDATLIQKNTYAPEFWKEVNGRLVQRDPDEINNEILDKAVKDPSVLGERIYRFLETKALERIEEERDRLRNDNIPDEDQAVEFAALTPTSMMKATLVERIAMSNKPKSDGDLRITDYSNRETSSDRKNADKEKKQKQELDWLKNRNIRAMGNEYNNDKFRYEFGEADENGVYSITVIKRPNLTDPVSIDEEAVVTVLEVDPSDESSMITARNRMLENSGVGKDAMIGGGDGETTDEKSAPQDLVEGDTVNGYRYLGGDPNNESNWVKVGDNN